MLVSIDTICKLGFTWPMHKLIAEKAVIYDGKIDLTATMEQLKSGFEYYNRERLADVEFKQRWGVDYSEFTDHHDERVELTTAYDKAIRYLRELEQKLDQAST